MRKARFGRMAVGLLVLGAFMIPQLALGADDPAPKKDTRAIRREIKKLEQDRARDADMIKRLDQRLDQLEKENQQLKTSNAQAAQQAKEASETVKAVQAQVEAGPSTAQLSNAFGRYLGSHTFDITGGAAVDFIYDQQNAAIAGFPHENGNTFTFLFDPIFLYRPSDWILGEFAPAAFFNNHGAGTSISLGDFQLEVNDYLTIVGGLFDNPFGDWWEAQSPTWVNRFITAPLTHGVEAITPPSEMGIQLRGGVQWGEVGQDIDYTVWGGDGPSYSTAGYGASLSGPTPIAARNGNGKSMGGRIRVYPLPLEAEMGRLELGASSYNGKYSCNDGTCDGSNWFTSWGVDFAYLYGNLQARGEWQQSYRKMGSGLPDDNREGWYVQAGYFLSGYNVPFLPPEVNKYIQRLEPLIRYSGVNQHFVQFGDIAAANGFTSGNIFYGFIPNFGFSGSPALFAPHAREIAIGLDYWIAPSMVWQNEFDIELPQTGGVILGGPSGPVPAGAIPNDRAFLSQFTVGF